MTKGIVKQQNLSLLQKPIRNSLLLPKRKEKKDFAVEKEIDFGLKKTMEILMKPVKENNQLPFHLLVKKKKGCLLHLDVWQYPLEIEQLKPVIFTTKEVKI